jgi:hypothetical protein
MWRGEMQGREEGKRRRKEKRRETYVRRCAGRRREEAIGREEDGREVEKILEMWRGNVVRRRKV